ncbi:helix-turn-helix transcriptional regulator [Burkholderia gladioli]|uniref:helix-turn-helix transcriptional regulator n=1 Tax=Burkholderia gladioli TaxID=28095 RepID=UPI00163F02B8|nr:AlpA family phage regulatory protein [Burkholderia gladioli]
MDWRHRNRYRASFAGLQQVGAHHHGGRQVKALRIKDVATKIGLGQSTIYRLVAQGDFPKPFEIMPKRNAWLEEDVDAWLAQRAGRTQAADADRSNITTFPASPAQ